MEELEDATPAKIEPEMKPVLHNGLLVCHCAFYNHLSINKLMLGHLYVVVIEYINMT